MNIFKFEFKMKFKSTIIWSFSVSFLIFIYMALFPSNSEDIDLFNKLLANYPEEFLQAFGLNNLNISDILGFLGFSFVFVQVCLAIQAANYGFSLVSVEERELTADFLLTKPISRTKIMTSKLLAAITCLLITNAFVWISSFTFINIFNNGKSYDTNALVLLLISMFFIQLFFLCFPLLISLLLKKVKSVLSFSMGLVFGLYILSAFGGVIDDDKLGYLTPFKHFEPGYIVSNSSLDMPKVLISITVIVVSVVASYILYNKRNIHSI